MSMWFPCLRDELRWHILFGILFFATIEEFVEDNFFCPVTVGGERGLFLRSFFVEMDEFETNREKHLKKLIKIIEHFEGKSLMCFVHS